MCTTNASPASSLPQIHPAWTPTHQAPPLWISWLLSKHPQAHRNPGAITLKSSVILLSDPPGKEPLPTPEVSSMFSYTRLPSLTLVFPPIASGSEYLNTPLSPKPSHKSLLSLLFEAQNPDCWMPSVMWPQGLCPRDSQAKCRQSPSRSHQAGRVSRLS